MGNRAQDIEELERLLNEGASFDELSNQAIKIFDRIGRDDKHMRGVRNPALVQGIRDQKKDFQDVVVEIKRRRGDTALDKFHLHERKRKQRFLPP